MYQAQTSTRSSLPALIVGGLTVFSLVLLMTLVQWLGAPSVPEIQLQEVTPIPSMIPEPNESQAMVAEPLPELVVAEVPLTDAPPVEFAEMTPPTDIALDLSAFPLDEPPAPMPEPLPSVAPAKPVVAEKAPSVARETPRNTTVKPRPRPKATPEASQATPTARPPAPKPPSKPKAFYGTAELDGMPSPRNARNVHPTWPKALTSVGVTKGTVTLFVEIDEKGRVSVLDTLSSTHADLEPLARQVAAKIRFTVPKRGGIPVKARFRWPLTLQQ